MNTVLLAVLALAGAQAHAQAQKTHEVVLGVHSEQVSDFQSHPHSAKQLSCDICHGPSVKHRTSTGAAPPDRVAAPDEVPALCGGCHAAQRKEYEPSAHGELVLARAKVRAPNCGTCHGVHAPRAAAAQCARCHAELPASHPKPAAGTCISCHSRHTLKVEAGRRGAG